VIAAQTRHDLARWTATGLVVVTYVLLVFGSTVRIHDAGLACPDWPMCFGQVVPVIDFEVGLEFGHRVLAGVVSLLFVGLGALVWTDATLRRRLAALWTIAAVVLATQIVLGGLTVLELLAEWTVTSHLLAGNTFCLLLLVHALSLWELRRPVQRSAVGWVERIAALVMVVVVFVQLGIGGFVASSHAGLACGTAWPNCGGAAWFPTLFGSVGLQVIHRLGAYVVLAVALVLVGLTRGRGRHGRASLAVLALLVVQATIGIANVWLAMPAEITALHSAGAAASVLAATWLVVETWRAPLRATSPDALSSHTPLEAR
jgi:cytochrome c oxidase assembly protein subunit 15